VQTKAARFSHGFADASGPAFGGSAQGWGRTTATSTASGFSGLEEETSNGENLGFLLLEFIKDLLGSLEGF
jgi:hypothetical protein